MVLRYCLGMIMSVSTLIILSGAATPSSVVNLSIGGILDAGFCLLMTAGRASVKSGVHADPSGSAGRLIISHEIFGSLSRRARRSDATTRETQVTQVAERARTI